MTIDPIAVAGGFGIPTLDRWTLALLACALAGLGVLARRRT